MFLNGRRDGAAAIQKAINRVLPGEVDEDGAMGQKTIEAYREAAANPETRQRLLDALAEARNALIRNLPHRAGHRNRILHFRFQKDFGMTGTK